MSKEINEITSAPSRQVREAKNLLIQWHPWGNELRMAQDSNARKCLNHALLTELEPYNYSYPVMAQAVNDFLNTFTISINKL